MKLIRTCLEKAEFVRGSRLDEVDFFCAAHAQELIRRQPEIPIMKASYGPVGRCAYLIHEEKT